MPSHILNPAKWLVKYPLLLTFLPSAKTHQDHHIGSYLVLADTNYLEPVAQCTIFEVCCLARICCCRRISRAHENSLLFQFLVANNSEVRLI